MRAAAFGLVAISLINFPAAFAQDSNESRNFKTQAPIAYMLDMGSGAVLYDKKSNERIPPASMTKMMTAYVVFEEIAEGRLKLSDTFTVSAPTANEWSGKGSTMFLKAGQEVSVENLLHGLITVSGNDAAIALADGISGSEKAFVAKMNAVAARIGLENSQFGTANGWPDEGRTLVTARDLGILAQRTMADFPDMYKRFYAEKSFTWNGVTQIDRNPLLGKVAGADGLKTGHTNAAGYCLTGSAIQNGRRLVMVVAGLPSYNSRVEESVKFMNWGFNAWRNQQLFEKGAQVGEAKVQLGDDSKVGLIAPQNIAVSLPKDGLKNYTLSIRYSGPLKAPLKKGQRVALLVTKMSDGSEQTMPLLAANDVDEAGFFQRAWNGLKSFLGIA